MADAQEHEPVQHLLRVTIRLSAVMLFALLALSGCHPTLAQLHHETAALQPPGARVVDATDQICRELLGANLTCRTARWQQPGGGPRLAAFIARAKATGWSVRTQAAGPEQRVFLARRNWSAAAVIVDDAVYRPRLPCPPNNPDGSTTTCADVVYLMWTGPTAAHDLPLALLISAAVGFAAGALIRTRRALWIAAAGPLVYAAMLVASPGYRVEAPLFFIAVVSVALAAGCAAGIGLGRSVRPRDVQRA
jgi:hypothetical protein